MIVVINNIVDQTAADWKTGNAQLTNEIIEPLRDVSPKGGAYGNEADVSEPDRQRSFQGANYPRLLSIKKKHDPTELFYVHHGVGLESWKVVDGGVVGVQSTDGPLCRV